MWRLLLRLVPALAGLGILVSAGKEPAFLISFHEEGEAIEGPKKVKPLPINGETRYFRIMPLFTQANIKAYWPFPTEDGSHGAVFWLDTTGQHVVERVGVANRGQFLATAVNRVPVDLLMVDGPVSDGRIVVWKGLAPELFQMIDKEKKIKRVSGGSPALAARQSAATPRGAGPVAGAPLAEGAVVGDIDPAVLESATSDLEPAAPKKRSRWNPFRNFLKEDPKSAPAKPTPAKPAPSRSAPSKPALPEPPLPEPPLPVEAPFQPDSTAERPDVVPLDDSSLPR
jgi:hypothetical protein